jgi:hypothetical protein
MLRLRTVLLYAALLIVLLGMGPCREPDIGPAPPITPDPGAPILPESPVGADP